jgi:hypothetical protein
MLRGLNSNTSTEVAFSSWRIGFFGVSVPLAVFWRHIPPADTAAIDDNRSPLGNGVCAPNRGNRVALRSSDTCARDTLYNEAKTLHNRGPKSHV